MNRPYDTARFKELIDRIRAAVPDVAITTDIIVGFPGETEADFAQTLTFAEACGFAKIHIFPYSKRKGTPAAERKDQLSNKERKTGSIVWRQWTAKEMKSSERPSLGASTPSCGNK